jgi:hypothetical protein
MHQPTCAESTIVTSLHDLPLFTVPQFIPKRPTVDTIEATLLIEELQQRFYALISRDRLFAELISRLLSRNAKAVVIGGWVRDHLLSLRGGKLIQPHDIDLVVDGVDDLQLLEIMPIDFKRNIFNGLKAEMSSTPLDIWLLQHTCLIQKLSLPAVFETLPLTTEFRINSVIFYPMPLWATSKLMDAGCLESISNQVLDFRTNQLPFPLVQAARAVIYGAKLNLRLHAEICTFIRHVCIDRETIFSIEKGIAEFCPSPHRKSALALLHHIVPER